MLLNQYDPSEIAAYVFGRRIAFDLTPGDVAELADVAEDLVLTIERGADVGPDEEPQRPAPADLAAVLLALDARPEQVAEVLGDGPWADDVLAAMV